METDAIWQNYQYKKHGGREGRGVKEEISATQTSVQKAVGKNDSRYFHHLILKTALNQPF